MAQLQYWIWLTSIPGLSLRAQHRLLEWFESPEAVFLADREAMDQVEGLTQREKEALARRDLRRAHQVLEDCRKEKIKILTMQDAGYPLRLRAIELPPPVLYYKGELLPFDVLPAITVVGSRRASAYGLTTAKRLGYQLGACGATVISGAARGIDSLALEGALSAGGPVAAVLGNGLDVVYPSEAKRLYEDVIQRGCLLSEYIPGTPPLGANFPRRNRIMSGLSLGVLVVEAAKRSGSLITAEFALEQGRDVFAVPGNVGLESCAGSNQLIQEGAELVTCGWDVLQGYQARFPDQLHRWDGGNSMSLSSQDRTYIYSSEEEQSERQRREKPKKSEENDTEEQPNSEKGIDNGQKRNYIDLQRSMQTLTDEEKLLMELLKDGPQHVDELIVQSGLAAAKALSTLTMLEVQGVVTQLSGKRFALHIK